MNILVLSDFFRMGGLESHIIALYHATKDENRYFFGFGEYHDVGILKSDHIYTGFHFSFQATVGELIEDVERLITIIRTQDIDVIHVHPWYSLFTAYFAANITEVKIVFTFHGTGSLNFTANLFDQIMVEEIFGTSVSAAFCVSKYGINAFASIGYKNTFFLPNPIDLDHYGISAFPGNKNWALISRIDGDKYPTIEKLVRMLPDLDIGQVDIYGDGECLIRLKDEITNIPARIELMGFRAEIGKAICGNYDGVIGLGRVAIEALAMGMPVLFAGYGKICGLISREDYPKARQCNFIPNEFKEKTAEEINKDIKEFYLRAERFCCSDLVRQDYNAKDLSEQYLRILRNAEHKGGRRYVRDFFEALKNSEKSAFFHNSLCMYELAKRYVWPNTFNMRVKEKFLVSEQMLHMDQMWKLEMNARREEMNACREELDSCREELDSCREELNACREELNACKQKLAGLEAKTERSEEDRVRDYHNTEAYIKQLQKQISDISSLAVQRNNIRILTETIRGKLQKRGNGKG